MSAKGAGPLRASRWYRVGDREWRFAARFSSFVVGWEHDAASPGHVFMFGPFAVRFRKAAS